MAAIVAYQRVVEDLRQVRADLQRLREDLVDAATAKNAPDPEPDGNDLADVLQLQSLLEQAHAESRDIDLSPFDS